MLRPGSRRSTLPGIGCVVLATAIALPVPAQDHAGDDPESTLIETATSELVLIEVYVTDRHGRPVRDLTADDFTLKVDRRKKPISSVELLEFAPPDQETQAPATSVDAKPATPAGEVPVNHIPRRFVLFFEDATSSPMGMAAVRHAAEEFISGSLVPDDQVAIVTYDNSRKMEVRVDFTDDREMLRQALRDGIKDRARISDFSSQRLARLDELDRIRNEPALGATNVSGPNTRLPNPMAASQASSLGRSYAQEDSVVMERVLRSLRMMVDVLAAWPGYRALVYIGEGIPENPGADYAVAESRFSLRSQMGLLSRAAAAAGVTLHTIQSSGLTAGSSAEVARASAGGSAAIEGSASRRTSALKNLAHGTGGLSLTSNDALKSLNDMEAGSRAYYLLGYVPEGPPDGLYHSVTVKVNRGRIDVRYRRGFLRLLPGQARERAVQAAHILPDLSPDLGLEMSAIAGPEDGKSRFTDLVVYVPANRILFLPHNDRLAARLELGLVALGDSGTESFRIARRMRIELSPDAIASRRDLGFNFFSRVRLPRSSQSITAVVSDLQGTSLGAARLSLAELGKGPPGVLGLSVYSLAEESMWIEVGGGTEPGGDDDAESNLPYRLGPALRTSFAADEPVACGFRMPPAAGAGEPLKLRLLIVQGEEIVRATALGDDFGSGGDLIKVPLPIEGLASGRYVVRVQDAVPPGDGSDRGNLEIRVR